MFPARGDELYFRSAKASAAAYLVKAAREAGDANFDVLIACAFNYEARTTDFAKLGRILVLKAA